MSTKLEYLPLPWESAGTTTAPAPVMLMRKAVEWTSCHLVRVTVSTSKTAQDTSFLIWSVKYGKSNYFSLFNLCVTRLKSSNVCFFFTFVHGKAVRFVNQPTHCGRASVLPFFMIPEISPTICLKEDLSDKLISIHQKPNIIAGINHMTMETSLLTVGRERQRPIAYSV